MNDKTIELLNRLADKFGTTAEHLWGVLVKQAQIHAANQLIVAVVLVVLWTFMFRFVRGKTTSSDPIPESEYPEGEWKSDEAIFAWVWVWGSLVFVLIVVCTTAASCLTALLNPEYWALKQLIP